MCVDVCVCVCTGAGGGGSSSGGGGGGGGGAPPGRCDLAEGFLNTELEEAVMKQMRETNFHNPYPFLLHGQQYEEKLSPRNSAPKVEYAIRNKDGSMPGPYEWGQFQEGYLLWVEEAPLVFEQVADLIEKMYGERPNHLIAIQYDDPKITVANAHHDKSDQWVDGASFFNLVLVDGGHSGSARKFQLLTSDKKQVVWESYLPHNSVLKVDYDTNKKLKHAVPERGRNEKHSTRWSIVLRCIGTVVVNIGPPRTPKYSVTCPQALLRWGFPQGYAFPFLKDCKTIIKWKDGTKTHLVDLIDERERKFKKSYERNIALANRDETALRAVGLKEDQLEVNLVRIRVYNAIDTGNVEQVRLLIQDALQEGTRIAQRTQTTYLKLKIPKEHTLAYYAPAPSTGE